MNLKSFIRDIPDFPKPGILFRDITPLLKSAPAFQYCLNEMKDLITKLKPDAIIGIESRGFIFGAPLANLLSVPFVPIRKPGKLPGDLKSVEYSLEYGSGQLDIHKDALTDGQRVVIVDDLLATGGTASAAAKLVEILGAQVAGFVFAIELTGLTGRKLLDPYHVSSLLVY